MTAPETLAFVGPGRAGLALGYALANSACPVNLTYYGRRPEPPGHPLFVQGLAEYVYGLERPADRTAAVILSVPDEVLGDIAFALSAHGEAPGGCCAIHMSGTMDTGVLAPLHARGYAVGSLHPMASIAHAVTGAERLTGGFFAVSGEQEALRTIHRLLSCLGARSLAIPAARRSLYHAAAALTANAVPALLEMTTAVLARTGVPPEDARAALLSHLDSAIEHARTSGGEGPPTGPIGRGDADAVRLHLRLLEDEERQVYLAMLVATLFAYGESVPEEARQELIELTRREMA